MFMFSKWRAHTQGVARGAPVDYSIVPQYFLQWGFTIAGPGLPDDLEAFKRGYQLFDGPLPDAISTKNRYYDAIASRCRYYDAETHLGMFCGLGKDLRGYVVGISVISSCVGVISAK